MKNTLILFFLISSFLVANAQTTVGLLYNDNNVSEGYTLFAPLRNNEVYLINNCGEKINHWTFDENPGATCYLLPNSNLLRAGKENLEIRDWSNNVVWSYPTTINGIQQHHDIEILPNGNILCIVSDIYSLSEITLQGRNPALTDATFKFDKIIELQPIGTNDANIVWEWKFIDHLIQDFDNTRLNYGIVQDHPELLDLNFNNGENFDFTHLNAIDYNSVLDQVMISARHLSEIYIIDHSTTTIEAAGHTGGTHSKGGDFLWRWGNSQVYRQGTSANQKLFLQHDCKWIEPNYLDGGKISVFNNGGDGTNTYSSIHIIAPEIINDNYTKTNSSFNPQNFEWSWNGSILGITLNEVKQSGVESQPNGNLLICETSSGRISEITKTGTLLWSYKNPTGQFINSNLTIYDQFSTIPPNLNGIFRAQKYPLDYSAFSNQSMTSLGIIEDINSLTNTCNTLNNENFEVNNISIINPANNKIQFNKVLENVNIVIYDTKGSIIYKESSFTGNSLKIELNSSLYFLHVISENSVYKFKVIIE